MSAWLHFKQGRCKEAQQILNKLADEREQSLCKEEPSTARALQELAELYQVLGFIDIEKKNQNYSLMYSLVGGWQANMTLPSKQSRAP